MAALDLGPLGQGGADLDRRPRAGRPSRVPCPEAQGIGDRRPRPDRPRPGSARDAGSPPGPAGRRPRPRGCGPAAGTRSAASSGDGGRPGRLDVAVAAVTPAPAHEERAPGPRVDQEVDVGAELGRRPRAGTTGRSTRSPTVTAIRSGVVVDPGGGVDGDRPGQLVERRDGGRGDWSTGPGCAGARCRPRVRPGPCGPGRAAPVGSPRSAVGGASAREARSMRWCVYSWTSSMRVPKAPFGWTKATVVPREPGRGAWSMTWPPWSLTDCRATAQSATR